MTTRGGNGITGVVLAGGQARRMGGEDKGLVELGGRWMIAHVIDALRPQVETVIINANRNLERYRELGWSVIADELSGFSGPLAGMASAMAAARTPDIVTVPCDSPLLPGDLVARLTAARGRERAEIAVAHDATRMQPVFALLDTSLLGDLRAFLEAGERKIDRWYARHRLALADFADESEAFINVNTPRERESVWAHMQHRATGGRA